MKINEIPTPETDAYFIAFHDEFQIKAKMQDLERRLTVARDALENIVMNSQSLVGAVLMAEEALTQTAPKQ